MKQLNFTDAQDRLLSKEEEQRFKDNTYTPEDVEKLFAYYKESAEDPLSEYIVSVKNVLRKYTKKMDRGQLNIGIAKSKNDGTNPDEVMRLYLQDVDIISRGLKNLTIAQGNQPGNKVAIMSESEILKEAHKRSNEKQ